MIAVSLARPAEMTHFFLMTNHRDKPKTVEIRERRGERRKRLSRGARIVFDRGASSVACSVEDLSSDGARLIIDSVTNVPDTFELRFDDGSRPRRCRVRWTSDDAIGVHFIRPGAEAGVPRFGRRQG